MGVTYPLTDTIKALVRNAYLERCDAAQSGYSAEFPGMVAAISGMHRDRVYRWQRTGVLTIDSADRLADALGLHPAELWPEWFDDVHDDDDLFAGMPLRPYRHGCHGGIKTHWKRGEKLCDECKAFKSTYQAQLRARPLTDEERARAFEHGCHGGIKNHRRRGEKLCDECKAFQAGYEREYRRRFPERERERTRRAWLAKKAKMANRAAA